MKTLTIRDFRTHPRQAKKTLAEEGEALLTSNGRPVALMLGVSGDSLEETVDSIRRVRALKTLREIRLQSKARGIDRLSLAQIDAIVAQSRRSRLRRPAK